MKILFYKIIIFVLPIFLLLAYFEYNLRSMDNSYLKKRIYLEKNIESIEVLIIGSSHANSGIDPEVFGQNIFNIANSAQDFFYDLKIMEKYIDKLGSIKTVIIPVSYHSFEYRISNGLEPWRCFYYSLYFGIESDSSVNDFDLRNYSAFALWEPLRSLGHAFEGFRGDTQYMSLSGFMPTENKGLAVLKDEINEKSGKLRVKQQHHFMKEENWSFNVDNLNNLFSLLRSKNIDVILITTPVTTTFYQNISKAKWSRTQRTIQAMCDNFDLKYYNYFFDKRFSLADFSNDDHLNVDGARKLTRILKSDVLGQM